MRRIRRLFFPAPTGPRLASNVRTRREFARGVAVVLVLWLFAYQVALRADNRPVSARAAKGNAVVKAPKAPTVAESKMTDLRTKPKPPKFKLREPKNDLNTRPNPVVVPCCGGPAGAMDSRLIDSPGTACTDAGSTVVITSPTSGGAYGANGITFSCTPTVKTGSVGTLAPTYRLTMEVTTHDASGYLWAHWESIETFSCNATPTWPDGTSFVIPRLNRGSSYTFTVRLYIQVAQQTTWTQVDLDILNFTTTGTAYNLSCNPGISGPTTLAWAPGSSTGAQTDWAETASISFGIKAGTNTCVQLVEFAGTVSSPLGTEKEIYMLSAYPAGNGGVATYGASWDLDEVIGAGTTGTWTGAAWSVRNQGSLTQTIPSAPDLAGPTTCTYGAS